MTEEQEPTGPVIRDRRRIDPETGQLREPRPTAAPSTAAVPPSGSPSAAASLAVDGADSDAAGALAERTADLQRLQAEYVNYKRRVDRDRETARQTTIGSVLTSLLPVLDDVARAREHDELTGAFKAVAESLDRTVTGLGLQRFGEPGEPFDPRIHEALMHSYSSDVVEPVCQTVLQVGYRLGDRVLRPARVAVAEPPTSHAADAEATVGDDAAPHQTHLSDASAPGGAAESDNSGLGAGAGGGAANANPNDEANANANADANDEANPGTDGNADAGASNDEPSVESL